MLLKRLELQGFKSFANRVAFDFEPGIAALIGPNGSGKSNVADAVRWVLGEQSARALRGRKAEEVIFVGSSARQPLGMAEAALVFDNGARRLSVDFAEIRVARRLYRSGETEYLLNGARVRRRDLVGLLAEVGLHSEGYTVIGQGAVEELVLQRPEERRLVLEHAADITRHQARLAEARARLAATEQNLARCADLIAELEPHARRLRGQAERAERYLARRAELAALARRYFRAALGGLEQSARSVEATLAEATEEVGRLEQAIAEGEAQQAAEREALGRLEAELDGLRRRQDDLAQERADLLGALGGGRQRAGFLEARLEALQAREASALAALGELRGQPAAAAGEQDLESETRLADELPELERQVDRVATEQRQARRQLDESRQRQVRLLQERQRLERDLQQRRDRAAREREVRAQLGERRAGLAQRLAAARERLDGLEQRQRADQPRLEAATARFQAGQRERQLAAREQAERRRSEQQAEGELAVARAAWKALQDELGGSAGSAAAGPRLGAALTVPPELEPAVTAALGEWAAAEVVDGSARAAWLARPARGRRLGLVQRAGGASTAPDAAEFAREAAALLGPLAHRPIAGLLAPGDRSGALNLGPLACTLLVDDLATAERAAELLRGRLHWPWQVVTPAGVVLTAFHGLARGAVSEADRLVSLGRRGEAARRRVEEVERQVAQERAARGVADERLAALEGAERELQAAEVELRAEVRQLDRQRDELRGELRAIEQELRRLPPEATSPSQAGSESDEAAQAERLTELERQIEAAAGLERDGADRLAELQPVWQRALAERDQLRRRSDQAAAERRAREQLAESRRREAARLERDLAEIAEQRAALETEQRGLGEKLAAQEGRLGEVEAAHRGGTAELERLAERRREAAAGADRRRAGLAERRRELDLARGRREAGLVAAQQARDGLARLRQEAEATAEEWGLAGEADVQLRLFEAGDAPPAEAQENDEIDLEIDLPGTRRRLTALQRELRAQGPVSELVLEEYREVDERLRFLTEQSGDLRAGLAELYGVVSELEGLMREGFTRAFASVNLIFASTFSTLFGGGTAQLTLTAPADPLRTGVDIVAQPPGKRLQSLMSLSGGERALTATALIFALLAINPLPFCVLDEVDAALDESNARRFATLLRQYSERTQFILITHNRATMEAARTLYGISMGGDGVTTVLSLRPAEALAHVGNGQR